MAAVGVAVTKELTKPGFLDEVTAMGDYLSQQLLALSAEFGMEGERGTGLLRALKLGQDIGEKIVEVEDRIAYQLPGTVIRDIAAPVILNENRSNFL
jgi:acetylornithine/succinyldiaminopimelate/putrescine aminotransferase